MSTRTRSALKRQQSQPNVEDADSKKKRIAKEHIAEEQPDKQEIAEKKATASGRLRRCSRLSAPRKLEDSGTESEEDFSDSDDRNFVLLDSDTSDDEKIVDEVPEYKNRSLISEIGKAQGRNEKFKKFSDEIEEPGFVRNNIEPVAGSGNLKFDVAASQQIKQEPEHSRARKAPNVKKEPVSDSDSDDSVAKIANRNSKTKFASKVKTEPSASPPDDSDDSVIVTKVKLAKRVKKVIPQIQRKTFTKPRKLLKVKKERTEIDDPISRLEMRLLKLANEMDNSDDSEGKKLNSSEQPEIKTEGETASVKAKLMDEGRNVRVDLKNEDSLPKAKRLTMQQKTISLINRKRKSSYLLCHRVHFLALVGHHRVLNSILNDDFVKAFALSRLPPSIAVGENVQNDSQVIRQILLFYKSTFELKVSDRVFMPKLLKANLMKLLLRKVTSCNIVYLFGLLALLRAGGIRSRLCLSYHLLPHKAPLLKIKDGQIVEFGSKAKLSDTNAGIADYFVEVYLSDRKRRWMPLDIDEFKIIEDPHELTPHLEQPVAFLIGIDADGYMIDLSPKYNARWLNKIKRFRGDPEFFEQVLTPFAPEGKEQAEEQQEAASRHEHHDIPKVISEFENHPKYALSQHLLKFEAFYPREPPILGYVMNEPVYPREAVHTLCSKESWRKRGRQVKQGEVAYNIVKSRPKWNKQTESFMRDLPLELYGEWQTELFKPPVAKNGVIPRNKFGNVELFHPNMLPIGTVHLKLAGLQQFANELGVDCVPAVVGFAALGKGWRPVFEGFVVCVEDKEILENIWNKRHVKYRQKWRETIRKRAVRNRRKPTEKKYKKKLEQE